MSFERGEGAVGKTMVHVLDAMGEEADDPAAVKPHDRQHDGERQDEYTTANQDFPNIAGQAVPQHDSARAEEHQEEKTEVDNPLGEDRAEHWREGEPFLFAEEIGAVKVAELCRDDTVDEPR